MNDELLLFGLFAEKFSYIALNKAVNEKVVEISTKQKQCRNNLHVFATFAVNV